MAVKKQGESTKPAAKPAAKAAPKKPTDNAFSALSGILSSAGLSAEMAAESDANYSLIKLDDILIKAQVRTIMEDDENSLEDLASSIKARGVIQPIVIRPVTGQSKPFELVAGERRYRASVLAGLDQIPSMVRELTDEEAEAVQFAENVQRKNLTQIETAERMQRDLDELGGDIDKLMEKYQKSRPWLSKWLSLLDLPEQAQRLVSENVSADLEVIGAVRQIEKVNPAAAKELVDDLAKTKGTGKAREKANEVKDQVKPSKKKKEKQEADKKKDQAGTPNPDAIAKPKDLAHQEPGPVVTVDPAGGSDNESLAGMFSMDEDFTQDAGQTSQSSSAPAEPEQRADTGKAPALPPVEALDNAYSLISESGADPKMVLSTMQEDEREGVEHWLHAMYDAGANCKEIGRAVILGFRKHQFAQEGCGAYALVAFLSGADSEDKFNLLNIIASVKQGE